MKRALAILLLFSAHANAELASHQTWLGGTMPGDVLGHREWDIELDSRVQGGATRWGLRLEQGVELEDKYLTWLEGPLMISYEWNWQGGQGQQLGFGTRWSPRLIRWFCDAFYLHAAFENWLTEKESGLGFIKSFHLGDWELGFNLGGIADQDPATKMARGLGIGRAGLRSPYVFWTLQAGLDAQWMSGGLAKELTPQIFINLPGDISLQAGATLSEREPRWSFVLGYEIFPSP